MIVVKFPQVSTVEKHNIILSPPYTTTEDNGYPNVVFSVTMLTFVYLKESNKVTKKYN